MLGCAQQPVVRLGGRSGWHHQPEVPRGSLAQIPLTGPFLQSFLGNIFKVTSRHLGSNCEAQTLHMEPQHV